MKTFIVATVKFSFPTPIALLIPGNTATCTSVHWCEANTTMVQNSQCVWQCLSVATHLLDPTFIDAAQLVPHIIRSITQSITIPVILPKKKKKFLYSLTKLQFRVYCTLYNKYRNVQYATKKKYLHSLYMKNWDFISFTLRYVYR